MHACMDAIVSKAAQRHAPMRTLLARPRSNSASSSMTCTKLDRSPKLTCRYGKLSGMEPCRPCSRGEVLWVFFCGEAVPLTAGGRHACTPAGRAGGRRACTPAGRADTIQDPQRSDAFRCTATPARRTFAWQSMKRLAWCCAQSSVASSMAVRNMRGPLLATAGGGEHWGMAISRGSSPNRLRPRQSLRIHVVPACPPPAPSPTFHGNRHTLHRGVGAGVIQTQCRLEEHTLHALGCRARHRGLAAPTCTRAHSTASARKSQTSWRPSPSHAGGVETMPRLGGGSATPCTHAPPPTAPAQACTRRRTPSRPRQAAPAACSSG